MYFTQYNNAPESQAANTKIDAYVKFTAMGSHLSGSLFIKNLTDKQTVSGLATGFPAMGAYVAGVGAPPRTYGVTVQYDF